MTGTAGEVAKSRRPPISAEAQRPWRRSSAANTSGGAPGRALRTSEEGHTEAVEGVKLSVVFGQASLVITQFERTSQQL